MIEAKHIEFLTKGLDFDSQFVGTDTVKDMVINILQDLIDNNIDIGQVKEWLDTDEDRSSFIEDWIEPEVDQGGAILGIRSASKIINSRLDMLYHFQEQIEYLKDILHNEYKSIDSQQKMITTRNNELDRREAKILANNAGEEFRLPGLETKVCLECKDEFQTEHKNKKYCSYTCSKRASNRRHRKRVKTENLGREMT